MPDRDQAAATDEAALPYPNAVATYPRLRQSLLASFDRCPLSASFALQYEGGWSGHDQSRGKVGHRVFARCLEEMYAMEEDSIPVELAVAILHEELSQRAADHRCPRCGSEALERLAVEEREAPPGALPPDWRCAGCGKAFHSDETALPAEQIADLRVSVIKWALDNRWDIANLASVEERLRAEVAYPPPLEHVRRTLSGALDALFVFGDRGEHAVVLDWKDTWALPGPAEVSFGGYFQQRFYGLLVLHTYPAVQRVTLREFYPRYSEAREATVDRNALPDVEAEMGALVERFDRAHERDLWKPSPGKHCSFCSRPGACPIFPDVRVEGRIETEDDAKRVAAELTVAQVVVDTRKRALKAYANARGPVPIADAKGRRQYGFVTVERTSRPDRDAVEAELRKAGLRGRDLNRLDLDRLFPTKLGTTFKQHSPGEGVQVTEEDARLAEQLRASLDRAAPAREREAKRRMREFERGGG